MSKEPRELRPATMSVREPAPRPTNESDAKLVSPFMVINRGEDSVDENNNVMFADFTPRVLPADVIEDKAVVIPKAESVPEPAFLEDSGQGELNLANLETEASTEKVEPAPWETPVPPPVGAVEPKSSPSEPLSPPSSSDKKTG